MLYDQYFIDDLKNRADLVRIVQPYAQDLKKKGKDWMACCPFHQEKSPSFSVSPSKGFYKCFGCGKGGNAFTFLMEMEGINFPEAIKRVAEISGVMLPEPIDDEKYERSKEKREETKKIADKIIELNQIALEFWRGELKSKNKKAKAARAYLEQRGISEETQKTFRIGYSPDEWDSLLNLLKNKGIDEKLIEQSGLVSVNEEKERVFDKFRGRIMFPVLDVNGRPIAFGARSLDADDQPKYLNSPETAAYVKGQHLYGLFQAKDEIRIKKFAILVEGYLDLIALFQFGVTNVAASLGTAFTTEQSKLLSRFSRKVVINYDGDSAGIKAAKRAVEQLLTQEFDIKVLVLPDGMDPDDFIRKNGTDAYKQLRGKAVSFLRFALDASVSGRNLNNAKQKAEAIEDFLPVIAAIRNIIQKRESFDQAMTFFQIGDAGLRRELWMSLKSVGRVDIQDIPQKVSRALATKITVAEKTLLELLIHDSELREIILPQLEESDYIDLPTRSLFEALFHLREHNGQPTHEFLLDFIDADDPSIEYLPKLLSIKSKREIDDPLDHVLNLAEETIIGLREKAIGAKLEDVRRRLGEAEAEGDLDLVYRLIFEHIELAKMIQQTTRHFSSNEAQERA